ncbi:MAG TPA: hydrogenase maturation protease [Candidatus Saccharimonadales bacterium]|nr:hydrogenase maturation protease [Candidatus Saccharimonadales bacterium]
MTVTHPNSILIGIGNPFRSDDRAGLEIVRLLKEQIPREMRCVEETGDGAELLDAWKGADCVILIDAIQSGAPPATVYRFDARAESLPGWFSHASTHTFGVAEAIELSRQMDEMPPKLIVYGIEGLDFSPGTELTPEVAEALPAISKLILREVLKASAVRLTKSV